MHGVEILIHNRHWAGWLRAVAADGHAAFERGIAMAVSLADCVPVFIGSASGGAILHSGWRGTAAGIVTRGVRLFADRGIPPRNLLVHLGPGICGRCYVVGPDVYAQLTGRTVDVPTAVDLRGLIATQAHDAGVGRISLSDSCTRCHNDRFFSHRAGDIGRQLGVLVWPESVP